MERCPTCLRRLPGSALFSTGKDDWCSPPEVLDRVRLVGAIELDPCSNPRSIVRARSSIALPYDGLRAAWPQSGLVYVNPPFSRREQWRWIARAALHGAAGGEVLMLVPARTDTKAWHRFAVRADARCSWRGRMRFLGAAGSAPFPSALLYWGPRVDAFARAFSDVGHVERRAA